MNGIPRSSFAGPRKICLLIHSLEMGGAERVAVSLANRWAEEGREVVILTLTSDREDFYELGEGVRRVRLAVANRKARNPFAKLWVRIARVRAVRHALEEIAPDFVIAYMADCNRVLALARPARPVVCVGTQHTYAPHTKERFTKTLSKKINYPKLDAVVALTDDMAKYLREDLGLRRVPVVPNPLLWPMPKSEPILSPLTAIDPETKTILAVGRLVPVKGFDLLIEAFARIHARLPGWNLVIVGEGPERVALEALVRRAGLEGRIRLPGRAGNVAEWYAAADVFALSSRREGFPMTLVEAMGAGLPCVAANCKTGPSSLIRDGESGLLVAPDDPDALAAGLLRLADDEPLRKRLGSAAESVRETLSPGAVVRLWDAVYVSLLG